MFSYMSRARSDDGAQRDEIHVVYSNANMPGQLECRTAVRGGKRVSGSRVFEHARSIIQRAWRSCRYRYNLSVVLSVLTCCAPEYNVVHYCA